MTEREDALGLFQIFFFLAILFYILAMFAIPNMVLFITFLMIAVALTILMLLIALGEREKRTSYNKNTKGRTLDYL